MKSICDYFKQAIKTVASQSILRELLKTITFGQIILGDHLSEVGADFQMK